MKMKSFLFYSLCILCISSSFAQREVNLGTPAEFASSFLNPARRFKQVTDQSIVGEIKFSDTLTIKYKVNKVEEDGGIIRVYGLLQVPHKGGVYIVNRGSSIEGDIYFAHWNKALKFETRNGQVYLKEEELRKLICEEKESERPEVELPIKKRITAVPGASDPSVLAVDVKKLQSYPGAKAVIYIDIDGHMSGQRWANSYTGGVQFYATPANISDDNLYTIWKVMSEDYKPFDINITTDSTVFLQYPTNRSQRLVVTRNSSWQTLSTTGIAYVNGFSTGDDPAFSFPGGFSSSNPLSTTAAEKLGEVSSHECGHTVGLSHDGTSSTSYYSGQGNWAPIMGSGYNKNVTQWSKGEYANANQLQDDLAIITNTSTNGFGYKADDCGNTYATSKSIVIATGGVISATDNNGVIEQSSDIDAFKFTTSGGTVTLHFGTALPKPNLDIKASLYNSSNTLIISNDVANLTYADISTTLAAGTYYVTIEGVGYGDPLSTGYSKYASIGYYEISGTIPNVTTGNQTPTVAITSPADGASFVAPASITISATAADADGTISKVEFYNGTTLLNTSTTSPFSYAWTSVAAGTYSLTAKAYDNNGAVTISAVVSVTVTSATNQSPVVSITSPTSGTTYTAPASITINATATDADGTISKVEFYNGATLLGTDNASPYSYAWASVVAGTYTLTAKAYDNASAVTSSKAVSITVTTASNGCTAPAWSSSTIYLGDSGSGGTGTGEVVSYNNRQYRAQWWTQNNAPGTNSVWLDLGACASANQLPTISITAPTNGAIFTAPASVTITATATDADGSISKVEFYNGTTLLNSDNASPYSYAWTSVVAGTYSLTAKAYDNSGAITTSSAVSITVNPPTNQLPIVSITAPSNGALFTAPSSVTITANATDADGTISKVEFYNGTTLLNSDAASPYSYAWAGVSAGTYSLTAKAYDNSGAVTTSTTVSITVNPPANQLPTVSITAPSNGATFITPASMNITANAIDTDGAISKVEFYNGAILLNSDNASPYSYTWASVIAGTYNLTTKAYDNSGAVTTSSVVTITVNPPANQLPTVSITGPINGATFTAPASVTITANATDADGTISKVEFYNGTTLLNLDNASPYSYAWTSVVAGTYSLTAKAYDNSGAITTSSAVSITVSPAQTGIEDCSNIFAWNSSAIYVTNDLVTYNGVKYKANYWTKNNNPSTSSNGEYDFWLKLGECIGGTVPTAGPSVSMSPAADTSLIKNDVLDLTLRGLTSGTVKEVSYYLYDGTTLITKISAALPILNAQWPANTIGDYALQVVVKDNKGVNVYANAISVKVTQLTSTIDYKNSGSLLVIPNPNNSRFHLYVPSNLNLKGAQIELTNMVGHKVYESIIISEGQEITPENLKTGIYFLKVTSGEKVYMTKMEVY